MTADIRQLRGGRVSNFLLRQNRSENLILQILVGGKSLKHGIQNRRFFVFGNIAFHVSGAAQDTGDSQQLFGLQTATKVCPFQRGGYICHITKNGVSLSGAKIRCRGGLIQHQIDIIQIRSGVDLQTGLSASGTSGALGKKLENLIQLQLQQ